ncbi:unnamed protein product, partial [marine sediment metagenome]
SGGAIYASRDMKVDLATGTGADPADTAGSTQTNAYL